MQLLFVNCWIHSSAAFAPAKPTFHYSLLATTSSSTSCGGLLQLPLLILTSGANSRHYFAKAASVELPLHPQAAAYCCTHSSNAAAVPDKLYKCPALLCTCRPVTLSTSSGTHCSSHPATPLLFLDKLTNSQRCFAPAGLSLYPPHCCSPCSNAAAV